MSRRRDTSLTIALCLSLVAHGGLVLTLIETVTADARRQLRQPPGERAVAIVPILLPAALPEKPPEPKVKLPEVERLPELPVTPLPRPKPEPLQLKSIFGEADGQGEAEHSAPGEEEMRAKHTAPENQAFLSRDPVGPGRVGDRPSMSTAKAGDGGTGKPGPMRKAEQAAPSLPSSPKPTLLAVAPQSMSAPPTPVGTPQPQQKQPKETKEKPDPALPFGVPSEKVEAVVPKKARQIKEAPPVIAAAKPAAPRPNQGTDAALDMKDVAKREAKRAAQAPPPPKPNGAPPTPNAKPALLPPVVALAAPAQPQVLKQEQSGGGRPGQATPAADPAPMSDSESDAFSRVANVEFSDGRVSAQFGRRIKTVRPKLLLSAQYEIFSQDNPRVLLSAKVDATGHPTKVDIYQSSGSPDLDQPCLVAVYDWWFEPPKDKDGKPIPDVVVVGITFRTR